MLSNYFYNATVKRIVSVFGTIFNNIKIARFDSGVTTNTIHVPISYGPRSKFLARITEDSTLTDKGVALKLPRMSFEMTGIDYDSTTKLNKLNRKLTAGTTDKNKTTQFQSVPYSIGMQLNIYAKNQDDALQIVEQILPTFAPEYSVTIKGIDGPDSKTDVPFILNSVSFQDDYEGDFTTRRTIIYTLDFTIKAMFAPGVSLQNIIQRVGVKFSELKDKDLLNDSPVASILSQVGASANSPGALDSPTAIRTFVSFINPDDQYLLTFDSPVQGDFDSNETITGLTSGVGGKILDTTFNSPGGGVNHTDLTIKGQYKVTSLEGLFTVGEVIAGQNSPDSPNIGFERSSGVSSSITKL